MIEALEFLPPSTRPMSISCRLRVAIPLPPIIGGVRDFSSGDDDDDDDDDDEKGDNRRLLQRCAIFLMEGGSFSKAAVAR